MCQSLNNSAQAAEGLRVAVKEHHQEKANKVKQI